MTERRWWLAVVVTLVAALAASEVQQWQWSDEARSCVQHERSTAAQLEQIVRELSR